VPVRRRDGFLNQRDPSVRPWDDASRERTPDSSLRAAFSLRTHCTQA
jgi:hypothetical protein